MQDKLKKLQSQHEDMSAAMDGAHTYRYPPGVPNFKCPPEAEWQYLYPNTAGGDETLATAIPRDSTRVEALEVVYHNHLKFRKSLETQVATQYSTTLKTSTFRANPQAIGGLLYGIQFFGYLTNPRAGKEAPQQRAPLPTLVPQGR